MKKKSFLQNFHTLPALCRTFGAGECEKAENRWKWGGIRLGPTLPAFLSPGVAAVLQEKYDLRPITTPEDDLAACLGRH